jgi:cytoskeletal protein CcmA (bactofilin family)
MLKAFIIMFPKPKNQDSSTPNTASNELEQRRSILHDGIEIKGDWYSDGIVEFGGDIVGDLTVDVLIVNASARVEGNVRARSVTIEGYVIGTIAAIDVHISPKAVFRGEIAAERIRIDYGADVEGRLETTSKATSEASLDL